MKPQFSLLLNGAILNGAVTPAAIAATSLHFDPAMLIFAASTLIGFLGIFVQQYFANKQVEKHRAWDLADRAAKAEETRRMIDENTAISRNAFKEANNVNEKIASLGRKLVLDAAKKNSKRRPVGKR